MINKLITKSLRLNKSLKIFVSLVISSSCLLMNSCQTPEGLGAITGAGIGALGGAVYSENKEKDKKIKARTVAAGAVLGALAGGVAGAIAKHKAQPYRQRDLRYGGDSRYNSPSYTRSRPSYREPLPTYNKPSYKLGIPTNTRNIVRSPHRPYSNIDVSGFRKGEVVQDENGNPFIVP